jgi:hypothetical protein
VNQSIKQHLDPARMVIVQAGTLSAPDSIETYPKK